MPNFEIAQLESDFQVNDLKTAVLNRLKQGETPFSVATWMQQDLLLYPDVGTNELSRAVRELYISYTPIADRMNISKNRSAIQKTAEKFRRHTSALEDMEFLLNVQMGRINLVHEEELRLREEREKARNSAKAEDEIEDMFDELEDKPKKGKKGKKSDSEAYEAIVYGVGANELETARRMVMDMHKIRQDLKIDPRGTEKGDNFKSSGPTEDYQLKRAKLVQDAVRKFREKEVVQ